MMIDWDDAFDNSGYVDGSDGFAAIWANRARDARARLNGTLDIVYGDHPRMKLDLFQPRPDDSGASDGVVVFVHGGYWHKLDKSFWSHLAEGPLSNGWSVAIIEYPLAPDSRISDITSAVADAIELVAVRVVGPIRLIGHSAGGHLVSRMSAGNSPLSTPVFRRLARVVSVSGVHDLRPLTLTRMNDTLGLTAEEAEVESPVLAEPGSAPVTFWVGADERPEFLRQTRLIAEAWSRKGGDILAHYQPEHNHFSVINSLSTPDGALTKAVLS